MCVEGGGEYQRVLSRQNLKSYLAIPESPSTIVSEKEIIGSLSVPTI